MVSGVAFASCALHRHRAATRTHSFASGRITAPYLKPRRWLEHSEGILQCARIPNSCDVSARRHILSQRQRFYRHMPAWLIRVRVPATIWKNYFKFCVDRNPWDKVLSHYHMTAHRQGGQLSLDQYLLRGKLPINYPRYTDS